MPADKLQEIQKAIELFSVGQGPAKTMEEATRRSYQFWDTQPVPKLGMTCGKAASSALRLKGDLLCFSLFSVTNVMLQRRMVIFNVNP